MPRVCAVGQVSQAEVERVTRELSMESKAAQLLRDEHKACANKLALSNARADASAEELKQSLLAQDELLQASKVLEERLYLVQQRYSTEVCAR